MMSKRDRLHLGYLEKARQPLWGGHLERGQPITDPDMPRWLSHGWIERVDRQGYILTAAGQIALHQQTPGS